MSTTPQTRDERSDRREGLCWGGPYDGKRIAAKGFVFDAARPSRLRVSALTDDSEVVPAFHVDRYRWERFAYRPWVFGAWVIELPTERREAAHQAILDGLNLVARLCELVAPSPRGTP